VYYLPSLSLALSSSFSSALKAAAFVLELAPEAGDLAGKNAQNETTHQSSFCFQIVRLFTIQLIKYLAQKI